jgi:hypothetical protein
MKETFSSEYERCDLRANSTKKGVIRVADTGIQLLIQPHQKRLFSTRLATFCASLLVDKQTFLDPSSQATRMTEESTGVTEESVGGWFR